MEWDPEQYSHYADERGRPFLELVAGIGSSAPRRVVDLGCGPGTLTAGLAKRWPDAVIEGIDSSAEMVAAAPAGVCLRLGDIRDFVPEPDVDVLVSNAALQWVPGHAELIRSWIDALPSGGWIAWQVPGNFASPSHQLMRSLAESPRWVDSLRGALRHDDAVGTAQSYGELLLDAGCRADVWETTYQHVLTGPDPVLDWVRGTGLRPVLAALDPGAAAEFTREYATALRAAYPPRVDGRTMFGFRRIFAVGQLA